VRELDRQRHELRRLVTGEAEHDALVAGAQVVADSGVDLGGLLFDGDEHAAAVGVEGVLGPSVADITDDLAGDACAVDVVGGGDLAEDEDEAGRRRDFAGDVGARIVAMISSRMASAIWSQTLSGWPSVTDSLVIRSEGLDINVMVISDILLLNAERMFHYDVDRNGEHSCGE
jgi:hypothetical protein